MATETYNLQGADAPPLKYDRSLHLPPDEASESLAGYDGILAATAWHRVNAATPELPYRALVPGIGVGTMAVAFCAYERNVGTLDDRPIEIDCFDIDESAVRYAISNMSTINNERVKTNCFQADWNSQQTWEELDSRGYNLVLLNPPYLPESEDEAISDDYGEVPRHTLIGGTDGLEHFRTVLSHLPYVLDSEHGATVLFRFQTPGGRYVAPLKQIIGEHFGEQGNTWPSGIFPTEGQASCKADGHGRIRWLSLGRIVIPAKGS